MVQNVYVGPDGGRRQPDRVVWLGSGRAWGWGRSAEVLGPRAESSLVLARRLAGTIEKSTPSVSWRFGALRLWLRRGPAGGRGRGGMRVGLAGRGRAWGAGVVGVWRGVALGGRCGGRGMAFGEQCGGRPALGGCWLVLELGGGSWRPGAGHWGAEGACWAWRGGVPVGD